MSSESVKNYNRESQEYSNEQVRFLPLTFLLLRKIWHFTCETDIVRKQKSKDFARGN